MHSTSKRKERQCKYPKVDPLFPMKKQIMVVKNALPIAVNDISQRIEPQYKTQIIWQAFLIPYNRRKIK